MSREYIVPICGGLGDAFLRYLLPGPCGCIADLRRKEPEARVRCALMSTNAEAATFLSPLFDSLEYEEWDGDYAGFVRRTSDAPIDPECYVWARPPITLSAEEARLAEDLDGCVALHPFAGTGNREWASRVDLHKLTTTLCDRGLTVAVLGGSSRRVDGAGAARSIVEEFSGERLGLVNLVGSASVALQARVAMGAKRFIGSLSAYHCAAFAYGVPTLLVAPRELEPFFAAAHPMYGTLRSTAHIEYFGAGMADRIVDFATGPMQ